MVQTRKRKQQQQKSQPEQQQKVAQSKKAKKCAFKSEQEEDDVGITAIQQVDWVDMLLDRLSNLERAVSELRVETLVSRLQNSPCVVSGSILGFVSDHLMVDIRNKLPLVQMQGCNLFVSMCLKSPGPLYMPHINYSRTTDCVSLHVDRRVANLALDAEFMEYFKRSCDGIYPQFCSNVSSICRNNLRTSATVAERTDGLLIIPDPVDKSRFLSPVSYGFDDTASNCIVEYMFAKFVSEKMLERQRIGSSLDITSSHHHPKFFIKNVALSEMSEIVSKFLKFCAKTLDDVYKLVFVYVPDELAPFVDLGISHRADAKLFQQAKTRILQQKSAAQTNKIGAALSEFAAAFPYVLKPSLLMIPQQL